MGKAKIFSEAMPFIKRFRGTTVVIKYGGSAMVDESLRNTFADDVAMLHYVGIKPVIVHGGGPHISRTMSQLGIEPHWIDGLRVTDEETMRVVQTTLAGEVNPDIVRLVNAHGSLAAGVNGLDANTFVARPKDERLGFVGQVTKVNPQLVTALQAEGYVPVVAPLARGEDGHPYNLNADTAAGALAEALGARKLVYLTDVEGLYRVFGEEDSLISRTTVAGLKELTGGGSISAGMLPKLESCIHAIEAGVARAHILDGRVQHALLLEIFTPEGIGTMITMEEVA
ncbi:MAG TPA: acetylglutamate kinase [Acidimicrobiia bacterium]|jgi:acetylglutamate kinase|nr:acetylglutamate kinase [Acidimicrobiia bacterium]